MKKQIVPLVPLLSVVFDPQNPQSTIAAFKPRDCVVFGDYFNEHWTMWKVGEVEKKQELHPVKLNYSGS